MSDREPHCPFLNRADQRCSSYFSIERLQHAFGHCFNAYRTCAVYQVLLDERQARRSLAASGGGRGTAPGQFVWTTACRPPERDGKPRRAAQQQQHSPQPQAQFVQIRLPSVAVVAGGTAAAAAAAAATAAVAA
jgi:hypothetical protein